MCAPENSAVQKLSIIIIIKNVHMEKLVHPTGVSYHCHYSPEAILITVTYSQRHLVLQG